MNTWRLRIRPRAAWATPWRADSLFGAVCWRWLELFPESFAAMLEEFHAGGEPPFVLSDAFPGDCLPLPFHVVPQFLQDGKKRKPPFFVSQASFHDSIQRGTNPEGEPIVKPYFAYSRLQTSINRDSDTAADGQLFETELTTLASGFHEMSLYFRTGRYLPQLVACFHALAITGFGKKSSTGLGAFEIVGEAEPCPWLDDVANANAFVSLSHFVPETTDPTIGQWQIHVTYPKLQGNAISNIFKGTMLMLTPGSVFRTDDVGPRSWYGRMLPVPRPEMPKALHYGFCFPAPLIWREEKK